MVSEEKGEAASGWLLENLGPSEWQLYCRKEVVGAVGLGILRGLDSVAWFRGLCGHLGTGKVGLPPVQCSEPGDADTWASFSGVC